MMAGVEVVAMRSEIARKFKSNSLYLRSDASKLIQSTLIAAKLDDGFGSGPQTTHRLDEILAAVSEQTLGSNFVEVEHINAAIEKLDAAGSVNETVTSEHILQVIPAFEAPKFKYSVDRKQFLPTREAPMLHSADADAKATLFRERFELLRQRTLRHRMFAKAAEGTSGGLGLQLSPLSSLLGKNKPGGNKKIKNVVVMGMISQLEEGKYFLEDLDASVRILLTGEVEYSMGLFTEIGIVLAEGVYDDGTFHAESIGFPPPELHHESTKSFGALNFFGGETLPGEQIAMHNIEVQNEGSMFVVLSDVWLDKPNVREKLRSLFDGFSGMSPAPTFVLMGNFLSQSYGPAQATVLKDSLGLLSDIITEFEELAKNGQFIFVPGPKDVGGGVGNILPRRALPRSCTAKLQAKVPNAHFGTNPTRVRYCTQEIVLFREDIVNKMRRNCILPPKLEGEENEITMHLLKTVVDQAHLCPLPLHVQPIYWEFDHALRLYPVPDVMILADKFDSYRHVYSGALAFNPGSFVASDFSFVVYTPAELRANQERHADGSRWDDLESIVQYSKIQ